MSDWKGIVAKGFKPDEFDAYVDQLEFIDWKPSFVVLHHTEIPTIAQWHDAPALDRLHALERMYRDDQDWSAGPHLFVADDFIWVFTPLTTSGIHSPSWNKVAWGLEMIGDYNNEPLNEGVYYNTIRALAKMHSCMNLDPNTLRFHREDEKTDHNTCPGKNIGEKPKVIRDIIQQMGSRD